MSNMIRRASYTPSTSGMAGAQEPLIVVEESGALEEEDEEEVRPPSPKGGPDSPSLNPFLLSPYRDMRKRSLPTPQCTSGITASQVRRLSEQGGEGKGPSPMEAAFLATLTQAPAPVAGGRRHSVVTISRAPPPSILFGRNRRESIAAFPGRLPRRDSSSSITGSNFNLQLDIMDDIAEIKAARKVRLKMWQNDNKEKVCEVQPVEGGSSSRYQSAPGPSRRFSDVTGLGIPGPSVPQKRRASEMPQVRRVSTPPPSIGKGIVCSNTDLISIMSSLTSSAQEINSLTSGKYDNSKPSSLDQKRSRLKGSRSNSFDVSLLPESKGQSSDKTGVQATNWFIRRHQPMATKKCLTDKSNEAGGTNKGKTGMIVTFADDKLKTILAEKKRTDNEGKENVEKSAAPEKVVWDKPTGSVVDAQVLGSAIEEFLNQRGGDQAASPPSAAASSSSAPSTTTQASKEQSQPVTPNKSAKTSWFATSSKSKSSTENEEQASASCDNSICSTLKDLFVK